MVMLFFSGTGNSKYVAELFSKHLDCKCHSIEENIDFDQLISKEERIGFCYPIYGSKMPRIMREFVIKYMANLKDKNIIILCTQFIFSGDGARSFLYNLPKNHLNVIYAEHIFMPNNSFLFPLPNKNKIEKNRNKADKKIKLICDNIKTGIIKKRGFNPISKILGSFQGNLLPVFEKMTRNSVFINEDCIICNLCVKICPMKNLKNQNGKIVQNSNCTMCFRCLNKCPNKAISILVNKKIKKQYLGLNK